MQLERIEKLSKSGVGRQSILVVEDNPGDFALVEEYLSDHIKELYVTNAKTYKEAKAILSSSGDDNYPEVILLDLSLPDKTGIDLMTEIIALSKNVPVIILTGYEDLSLVSTALSLGVSDYLLKDELSPQTLYKTILHSCERKKTNLQLLNYIDAIEEQNKQLRDIAWIQSHVVRAPLARIIGLLDLFKNHKNSDEEKRTITDYLLESVYQLDNIIKDITDRAHEKLESIDAYPDTNSY